MPAFDQPVHSQELAQGLHVLQTRQSRLKLWALLSSTLACMSIVLLFFQQDIVLSFFGLSSTVQYLHLPVSVQEMFLHGGSQQNYFWNLLQWLAWLMLKIVVSFIGAFVLIAILRKMPYFLRKFQSFVLKFVGWMIAFILIWSGLSLWQHQLQHEDEDLSQQIVHYEQHIQDSEMAAYLRQNSLDRPIHAYLLAQTALLHRPVDISAAQPYVAELVQAERQSSQFAQYGFQAEQLWAMQQQLYGKSVTASAQALEVKVQQANKISQILHWMLVGCCGLLALISLLLWGSAKYLQRQLKQIGQHLLRP